MMPGSSPLARGLLRDRIENRFDRRIIPARAGFTVSAPMIGIIVEDHPRSRGVYSPVRRGPGARLGSSPLARGLPTAPSLGERVDSDHPRSRGVYHVDDRARQIGRGIIPARAGFTRPRRRARAWIADHPRSRGVYSDSATRMVRATGSSPLARGLRDGEVRLAGRVRIIPARAGFTAPPPWCGRCRSDHPRSRGVYANDEIDRWTKTGSSPLARGLPNGRLSAQTPTWIIPARAGFTVGIAAIGHPVRWIIPARAGFTRRPGERRGPRGGSSPLARGLRRPRPRRARARGIIPARAGFT